MSSQSDLPSEGKTDNWQYKNATPLRKKWGVMSKVAIILGIAAVVTITFVIMVLGYTSAPIQVSNQYISYIQNDMASEAWDLMYTENLYYVDFQQFALDIEKKSRILNGKPQMTGSEVSKKAASEIVSIVDYEIIGSDNATYGVTVILGKVNDTWKVYGYKIKKYE